MSSTINFASRRTHVMAPKKTKPKFSSSDDFEIWDDSKEEAETPIRTPQKKSTRSALGNPSKTPSGRKTKALSESNSGHAPQKSAQALCKKISEVVSFRVASESNDENTPRVTYTVSKSTRNSGDAGTKTPVSRRVRTTTDHTSKENSTDNNAQPPSETVTVVTTEHQIDDEEDEELLRMYANLENMPPSVPLPGVDPANDLGFAYLEDDKEADPGSYSPSEHVSGMYGNGEQIDHQLVRTVSTRDFPVPSSTTSSNRTTPIGAFTSPIPFEEFEAVTRKIVDAKYEIRRGPLGELSVEHLIKENWRVSIPSTSIISLSPSPTEAVEYTESSPVSREMVQKGGGGATPPPKILDGKSAIEHRLNHPLIKPSTNPESDFEIFEDKLEDEKAGPGLLKGEKNTPTKIVRASDCTDEIKDLNSLHYGDGFGDPGMNIIYMRHICMQSPPPPYTCSPPSPRSKPATAHTSKLHSSIVSESATVPEQKHAHNNGSPNQMREVFEYKPSKLRIISTSPTSSSVNEFDSTNSPSSSSSVSRDVQTQTSENVPEPNKMPMTRKNFIPKLRKVPSQIRRTPPNRSNNRSQSAYVPKSIDALHQTPVSVHHNSARQSVHQSRTTFVRSTSFSSFRDPADSSPASPVSPKNANADENDQAPETSPTAHSRRYYRRSRGNTPTGGAGVQSHVMEALLMESMRI